MSVLVEVCVYLAHITWTSVNTTGSTRLHISWFYLITGEDFWTESGQVYYCYTVFYRTKRWVSVDRPDIMSFICVVLCALTQSLQTFMHYTIYNSLALLTIIVPTILPCI